jgi:RNA polymerase sigma-70 factor (ECF subfamily)
VRESLDIWFTREILIHEAALMRYLARLWRQPQEIADLRQEIYIRIYDAARKARPLASKSFLFSTARHLMADRLRRERIVSIEAVGDTDLSNVLVDELSPERKVSAWRELNRVARALNRLPPKCREVIWLRKVDDLSIEEIAARLGISARTVEGQIRKGMRRVTESILGTTRESNHAPEAGNVTDGNEHGQR